MNLFKMLTAGAIVTAMSFVSQAQVSKDSISSLKQQKESLALSTKINSHKMQLAKLENTLEKKNREVETTTADAQKAAEENAEAAAKLSSDPQDRKAAKRAENAGDNARKKASRARSAASNLEDLRKDIESLKNKIADEESKLALNPVAIPGEPVREP